MLDCWCPTRCVVKKVYTMKNRGRSFYTCPLSKEYGDICNFMFGLMKLKNYDTLKRMELVVVREER